MAFSILSSSSLSLSSDLLLIVVTGSLRWEALVASEVHDEVWVPLSNPLSDSASEYEMASFSGVSEECLSLVGLGEGRK